MHNRTTGNKNSGIHLNALLPRFVPTPFWKNILIHLFYAWGSIFNEHMYLSNDWCNISQIEVAMHLQGGTS